MLDEVNVATSRLLGDWATALNRIIEATLLVMRREVVEFAAEIETGRECDALAVQEPRFSRRSTEHGPARPWSSMEGSL